MSDYPNSDLSRELEEPMLEHFPTNGLPELCYTSHPVTKLTVVIRRGAMGYYDTEYSRCCPDVLNCRIGVTKEQEQAMVAGSMFGWDCPGAKL